MLRFYSAFTANFYVYVKEWSISVCTCVILYIKLNVTGAINKITKGEFLFSFYIFPLLPLTYKNVFLLCVCVCFFFLYIKRIHRYPWMVDRIKRPKWGGYIQMVIRTEHELLKLGTGSAR